MIMINISLLRNLKTFTSETFTARLKQASLASKDDFANFVKQTDFDNKLKDVISNKIELNHKKLKQYQPKD